MKKTKRSDEEQVYDVHGFIGRYMTELKKQQIPFNKEQIGVLECLLLAENQVPVKSLQEDPREKLLNQKINWNAIKRCSMEIGEAISWLIRKVSVVEQHQTHWRDYTNRDALDLYTYFKERDYINIGEFNRASHKRVGAYLRQNGLLPPEEEHKTL